jgi:hypothetical protein
MTWTLKLEPRAPTVLADGPMPLSLELVNAGAEDEAVPQIEGTALFEYSIHAADGELPPRSASRMQRRRADVWLSNIRPMQGPDLVVAPGGSARFEEDLVSLLTEPLEPGRYLIEASYDSPEGETCTSERVPLEVVVSRPHAIAQTLAVGEGRVVIAEWHLDADGTTRLRARQKGKTPLGWFSELATLDAAEPVGQCAISTNAAYGILEAWRWLAWTSADALRVGVAHGEHLMYRSRPIRLELEAPSLLPIGYTVHGARAVFVVAGKRDGRPLLRLVGMAPGLDAEPVLTDVQLEPPTDGVPSTTCVWTADGPPELVASWVVEAGGATSILLGRVNARSGEVVAALGRVFTTDRSVLAFAVPPTIGPAMGPAVGSDEQRRAQVLLAPARLDGSQFTHVTFDMGDPANVTAHELPSLPAFAARGVDRWVLPSDPVAGAPVLAVGGAEIWAAGGGAWTRLATGDVEPSSVRLWAFAPTRLVCSWFDRARGYRWQRLQP